MKKSNLALIALVFITGCQLPPRAPAHTISFRASAEINVKPDIANFSITVRQEAKTVFLAQQEMTKKTNKVLELFNQKLIETRDIKTTDYRTAPQYTYENKPCAKGVCPATDQVLKGYEATQSISLKLRDLSKAGEILSELAALEVTEVSGPNFAVENYESLKSQAQAQAIAKVKMEAASTAKNLGVTLKKIISFNEDFGGFPRPRMMMAKNAAMESSATSLAPRLEGGEEKITSSVSITYEIE